MPNKTADLYFQNITIYAGRKLVIFARSTVNVALRVIIVIISSWSRIPVVIIIQSSEKHMVLNPYQVYKAVLKLNGLYLR